MQQLLNAEAEIRVQQHTGRLTNKTFEALDQLLLILPARGTKQHWRTLPGGGRLQAAAKTRKAGDTPAFVTRLANKRQTLVVGGRIDAGTDAFQQLTLGRKLVASAIVETGARLGICVHGFDPEAQATISKNLLSAALAAGFSMPSYKSEPMPAPLRNVRVLGLSRRLDLSRVQAEAAGNNLARWLTSMPPNKLDARTYAAIAQSLAKQHGWQYKRLDTAALKTLQAGAFLAVAQGNQNDSAGIVRLRYRPGKKNSAPDLSLVGKGIIFDTGGTNLKPFRSMLDMHGDMQGSAVALGALLAISRLKLPLAVDCWLAITENRTGPEAYKSQDLVKAANGKTIQTIHTDAEGRMALADTLVLASRERPKLMLDYATLTGSCVDAITTRYCGVFTNRSAWHPKLKRTGFLSGERVWPFPIGKEFLEDLKSDNADLMQCTIKGTGDHIMAGSFLAEFVENDTPWVHIDLSASDHEGGLAHVPTKVTGFGVRYTMSLLLDTKLHETGA